MAFVPVSPWQILFGILLVGLVLGTAYVGTTVVAKRVLGVSGPVAAARPLLRVLTDDGDAGPLWNAVAGVVGTGLIVAVGLLGTGAWRVEWPFERPAIGFLLLAGAEWVTYRRVQASAGDGDRVPVRHAVAGVVGVATVLGVSRNLGARGSVAEVGLFPTTLQTLGTESVVAALALVAVLRALIDRWQLREGPIYRRTALVAGIVWGTTLIGPRAVAWALLSVAGADRALAAEVIGYASSPAAGSLAWALVLTVLLTATAGLATHPIGDGDANPTARIDEGAGADE